jgi:hypothetical protein
LYGYFGHEHRRAAPDAKIRMQLARDAVDKIVQRMVHAGELWRATRGRCDQ